MLTFEEEEFRLALGFLPFFLTGCTSVVFRVEAELACDVIVLAGKLEPEGNPNSFCLSIHRATSERSLSYLATDSTEGYTGRASKAI